MIEHNVQFTQPPKNVGYWRLTPPPNSFSIGCTKKPSWLKRMFTKWLLGWEWLDGSPF